MLDVALAAPRGHLAQLLHIFNHTEIGIQYREKVIFPGIEQLLHLLPKVVGGNILQIVRYLETQVFGLEGCPVKEGLAIDVVGRKDHGRWLDEAVFLGLGSVGRHQNLGKSHVALRERPEEGAHVVSAGLRGHSVAADDFLTGGRGGDERLLRLLAGLGEDIQILAVEGTHDGHHTGVTSQFLTQRFQVGCEFVVPLQLQAHTDIGSQLPLLEVIQEPLGGAFQLCLGNGTTIGIHHRHLFVHPTVLLLNHNTVGLLRAAHHSHEHHAE